MIAVRRTRVQSRTKDGRDSRKPGPVGHSKGTVGLVVGSYSPSRKGLTTEDQSRRRPSRRELQTPRSVGTKGALHKTRVSGTEYSMSFKNRTRDVRLSFNYRVAHKPLPLPTSVTVVSRVNLLWTTRYPSNRDLTVLTTQDTP